MIAYAWTWVRALSLDVAAGGACGAALAATVTGAILPPSVWLVLPAAIWCVYTADHLLDARRLGTAAATLRHRVHATHARPLAAGMALVAAGGAVLAFTTLPARVAVAGVAIASAAGVHLLGARRAWPPFLPKEVSTAAIYTAGVWCAPLLLASERSAWAWPAMALFFIAVTANLLLNALVEAPADASAGFPSAALAWGGPATARTIVAAAALVAMAAPSLAIASGPRFHGVFSVLLVLGVVPALLLRLRARVEPHERYRAWGDLAYALAVLPFALR